jgi:hypothetical protein
VAGLVGEPTNKEIPEFKLQPGIKVSLTKVEIGSPPEVIIQTMSEYQSSTLIQNEESCSEK